MKDGTNSRVTAENLEKAGIYEVVYPLGRLTAKDLRLAPNISDLRGKTICGAGHPYNGDDVVAAVAALLAEAISRSKIHPDHRASRFG